MNAFCAAVDWGTTSFRIWLVSEAGETLAEQRSNEGMAHATNAGFANILNAHLESMGASSTLPVVICGMAGSRQGWTEARYLNVPAELSDIISGAVRVEDRQRDIRILPGLAQRINERPDVMRGEETQLLGGVADQHNVALACMPGTHSKWVRMESARVTAFSTYMTGELFGLISRDSILQHAMGDENSCDPHGEAFVKSVRDAHNNPTEITRLLFSIRAGQLLYGNEPERNFARLSGLLIGGEIAAAISEFSDPDQVHLIASGKLFRLYEAALNCLGVGVVAIDADDAVLSGLLMAAKRYWPRSNSHYGQKKA